MGALGCGDCRDRADPLPFSAQMTGYKNPPTPVLEPEVSLAWLKAIYDKNLETHLQDIYQQDYLTFGFEAWSTT